LGHKAHVGLFTVSGVEFQSINGTTTPPASSIFIIVERLRLNLVNDRISILTGSEGVREDILLQAYAFLIFLLTNQCYSSMLSKKVKLSYQFNGVISTSIFNNTCIGIVRWTHREIF